MSDSLRFRLHWNRLPAVRTIRTRLTFASTSTKLAGTTNSMEHGPKSSKWEVENGQYTRPFDPFEETFSSLCHDRARPEFRSLDAVASIGIETLPNDANAFLETLKKAWARIRYLHPFLASEVGPKAFRYTPLQGQSDIDEWLQKTLIIKDWDSESEVQGCQDLAVAPATQAPRLYYFPGKRRLIIRMNHMHIDGHGLVSMLQDLFAEMHRLHYDGETVNEPWGEEVQNLASSAFDAAGIAALKDPCSLKLPQPRADGEAFEFPSINTTFPPASGKTQSLDFTESQTSEFLCHAKGSGLGITAFVHAALIHAGKAVCPSSRSTVHSNFIIFNFREKCTASPVNAHLKATALRIGFWPIQVHIDDEFRRTAFRVRHEYESLASRKHAAIATMVPYLQKAASLLSKYYFKGILPSFIGNLSDVFPETYDFFKVQHLWMVAVPTDERIYLGIQTFGNKLSIRACYNQTYHTDEQIADYLMQIKQEMYTAMGSNVESLQFLSLLRLRNLLRILRGW